MCLYTRNCESKVAKKDIKVLKYLKKNENYYRTPYRNIRVTLNKPMVAKPSVPNLSYCTADNMGKTIYCLEGGAIHATLYGRKKVYTERVAVIPAGTEYWINSFGKDIAAKRMIVTGEENYVPDVDFALDILDEAPGINGIRVADYFYSDGSFKHPSIGSTIPVGVVVGFYNDKPLIAALNILRGNWNITWNSLKIGSRDFGCASNALTDLTGYQTTKAYKEINKISQNKSEIFEACINYGTDNENWYFPAAGEVAIALDNALFLNAAVAVSGFGEFIDDQRFYTCSSSVHCDNLWVCYLGDSRIYCCTNFRNNNVVIPFLAYL